MSKLNKQVWKIDLHLGNEMMVIGSAIKETCKFINKNNIKLEHYDYNYVILVTFKNRSI